MTENNFTHQQTVTMVKAMIAELSLDDLAKLCQTLHINPEEIRGGSLSARARELLQYTQRRGRLGELVIVCHELWPEADWPI